MNEHKYSFQEDGHSRGTRRRVLALSAGALTTGLAGCTGTDDGGSDATPTDQSNENNTPTTTSSPEHHFNSPPYENVEREEGQSTSGISGEIVLESGEYAQQEIRIEQSAQFSITGVNEGEGNMDVFLLTPESAFAKYQEAESAVFSGGLVATEITEIEQTVEISEGSHFLVFDNTAVYGAEPQGTVRFEFEVTVQTDPSTPTETEEEDETEEEESETPTGENNAEIVEESDMPKIKKVTDNFGHTFVWDSDSDDDDDYSVEVEEEVIVSDETTIQLTVEEILANPEDDISYSYSFGSSVDDHPDNTRADERIKNNKHTWNMRREDHSSGWRFRVYIRNEDDIYYQNESIETDFIFYLTYSNLSLEE